MPPIGGIMADRMIKQQIMFWLDLTSTVIIVLYMMVSGLFASAVPIVIVKLLALNAIKGLYIPVIQASVPVLVPQDKLIPANSVTSIVNTLASMLAPAIAGIVYSRFGLFPILIISAICFAVTALMDLLIRIPFKKQESHESVVQMVKSDISQSVRFVFKDKPVLAKGTTIALLLNISVIALLIVGLPIIITQHLDMSMAFVGINQSIVMIGGVLGSVIAGALSSRLSIHKLYQPLIASSLFVIPLGFIYLFNIPAFVSYVIITVASALIFLFMQICSIQMIAYVQAETPVELIGKVMSVLMTLPFLANAIGMTFFGSLFEVFSRSPWIIIFATAIFMFYIAFYSYKHFKKVP